MQLLRTLLQTEANSELFAQRFFVVAHDIEAAALGGAFGPEGTDDYVAPGPNRGSNLPNVGGALFCRRQEVEYGSVVPHVVSVWREVKRGDVADEPTNLPGVRRQSLPSYIDRGLGNIQDRDVLVAAREKIVDERGFASTDINNCRRWAVRRSFDERKGRVQMGAIPAHLIRRFGCVDFFPMRFRIHLGLHPYGFREYAKTGPASVPT